MVLINGQRQAAVPIRLAAGRFVDINSIPAAAIERVEILKEGAAATYGSDAVSGVVNFITRSDFEGFEVQGNFSSIDGSDGDFSLGAIYGTQIGEFDWVTNSAVSASMVCVTVAITPSFINSLITSAARSAIRLESS